MNRSTHDRYRSRSIRSIAGFGLLFTLIVFYAGPADSQVRPPSTPIVSAYKRPDQGPGNMKLLPGYVAGLPAGSHCIDTECGYIWNPQGLTIQYDIGGMAGVSLSHTPSSERQYLWYGEAHVNGQLVRYSVSPGDKTSELVVCYPDSQANFHSEVRSDTDLDNALKMLVTYQGIGFKPQAAGMIDARIVTDDGAPVPRTDIALEGRGVSLTARTDDDGHFRFADLAPGHYKFTAQTLNAPECDFGSKSWKFEIESSQILLRSFTVKCRQS